MRYVRHVIQRIGRLPKWLLLMAYVLTVGAVFVLGVAKLVGDPFYSSKVERCHEMYVLLDKDACNQPDALRDDGGFRNTKYHCEMLAVAPERARREDRRCRHAERTGTTRGQMPVNPLDPASHSDNRLNQVWVHPGEP